MSHAEEVPRATEDVIEAFATLLMQTGRSRLELGEILEAWMAADRGWASTVGARLRVADALETLASRAAIELPSRRGRLWDAFLPSLPVRIGLPSNRKSSPRALEAASEPWVPALSWAGSWIKGKRPPQRLRLALVAVNRWMSERVGAEPMVIAREERSLEIFSDEKLLASLSATTLFEPGRLTLQALVCEPPVGGLRVARLCPTGTVLVVENKATFDSVWRSLRREPIDTRYAGVVFGGGEEVVSLVPDLIRMPDFIGVQPEAFEYFGDLDVAGVRIAAAFLERVSRQGGSAGLAHRLWDELARREPTGDDLTGDDSERREALHLGRELGLSEQALSILRSGKRVAQERLDRVRLADRSWWVPR